VKGKGEIMKWKLDDKRECEGMEIMDEVELKVGIETFERSVNLREFHWEFQICPPIFDGKLSEE
jgi:hypothetical protein